MRGIMTEPQRSGHPPKEQRWPFDYPPHMSATSLWRKQLEGRAIPQDILEAAPESPWTLPTEPFRRRAERSGAGSATPTTTRALEVLPPGGSVLDVGSGSGATSLPLTNRAGRIVAVDASAAMLAGLTATAATRGVDMETIEGTWPDVADRAPRCDVAVCGHVLYNVPDLDPFLRALDQHAQRRVVVELTEHHPLAWMADLWQRFHGIVFPGGPTAGDAIEIVQDLGYGVHRDERQPAPDASHGGFERRQDAIALVRRRLCLSPDRDAELAEALGDRLRADREGLWSAGPLEQTIVTLWWNVAS
jgi:SAM-dependent methyltransferase